MDTVVCLLCHLKSREQLGNVFTQADADDHFSDHVIGMEIDHLSALTRRVIGYT